MFKIDATNSRKFEDSLLLEQINQGCKQSFNRLYEKHWESTYESAYKRLQDSEQAKDIVQEIFTHIWLKRETLRIQNFPAYINVAVRNRVIKIIAGQKSSDTFFKLLENLPNLQVSSDSPLLTKEFLSAYEKLLNTLPSKKQLIFRLRYEEDLPTKDIARYLKISRKTVQNQLGKAIEQLRITIILFLIQLLIILPA